MRSRTDASSGRGFTMIETLVTLVIVSIVLIGLLTLLDSSNKLSKQETQVADAQASARSGIYEVTRIIRQAGLGQLSPLNAVTPFVNNALSTTPTFLDLTGATHTVRLGTDAIEVRGNIFGEQYFFDPADVTCGGGTCSGGSNNITIIIKQQTSTGMTNYPAAGLPEVMTRTGSFYFVVASTSFQQVTGPSSTLYLAPLYYVGKVTRAPSYTVPTSGATSYTVTTTMDSTDSGARLMNATADTTPLLQRSFSGGVIDDIVLLVDRGRESPSGSGLYPSPYLAMALRDAATGNWNVSPLIDDVEDMQIAYGVDGADGSAPDRGVDPMAISTTANADEWVFNVAGETLTPLAGPPVTYPAFLVGPTYVPSGLPDPAIAVAALRAVNVGLVVKSTDPDFKFKGPGALPSAATKPAIQVFDSTAPAVSATQPYRRRVQTMAVTLRNFL